MSDLVENIMSMGGPYFEACWKRNGQWQTEKFRLFTRAKQRCIEELKAKADMVYVKHLITDEPVWSEESRDYKEWCNLMS